MNVYANLSIVAAACSFGIVQMQMSVAWAQPPQVVNSLGATGLHVPLDNSLFVDSFGVNQIIGSGWANDDIAARTTAGLQLARYKTSVGGQSTPTSMPANQDWAVEIGYKHTGGLTDVSQQPWLLKNFQDDVRMLQLNNDGGDSWSLRAGNFNNTDWETVVSGLELKDKWNTFKIHYKACSQTVDAYLNNKLIAPDFTFAHGRYDVDHLQLEGIGSGTDWFDDIKIGQAVASVRSPTFGNEWVREHPLTLQGLVLRDNSLNDTRYRNANFTSLLAWENRAALVDKAWEIQGLPWRWHTGKRSLDESLQSQISSFLNNRPGGEGFLVWDEPTRPDFAAVAEVSDWIKQNYPEMLVYGNLSTKLSPIRSGSNYGQEYGTKQLPNGSHEDPPVPYDYETFVDDYLHVVHPDILQFDSYPFLEDDPDETTDQFLQDRSYYDGLEIIRSAGLRANIPYQVIIQSYDGGGRRQPSESDLRMEIFAPLAYGFKGLTFFTFDHFGSYSSGNTGGLLRATNASESAYTPNPSYYFAQSVNREVARLGETLKMLDSTQVRYVLGKHLDSESGLEVANKLPLGVSLWNSPSDDPYITRIEAINLGTISGVTEGDLLVGHFRPSVEEIDGSAFENETYFMIVNLLRDKDVSALDASQSVHIEFDFGETEIDSLQRVNRNTGLVEIVSLASDGGNRYHLDLTLPGGTGDLFKYNTGAPFIVGQNGVNISADFDNDGDVDGDDFLTWQRGEGKLSDVILRDGDANGDRQVDELDLAIWQAQLGIGIRAANAVPEPKPLAIALAWLGLFSSGMRSLPPHFSYDLDDTRQVSIVGFRLKSHLNRNKDR